MGHLLRANHRKDEIKPLALHLFSVPGEPFLADIIAAARQVLEGQPKPVVAYLPAAAEGRHFVRETRAAFRGLAEVRAVKPEIHSAPTIRSMLDSASLLYIPGGNTYLAAQRLHAAGLMADLRRRILDGLPLVAFSAGTVLCGVDILTSNDQNDCGCTHFTGFGLAAYNFNVHYPPVAGEERKARDARLSAFSQEHHRPVVALEDGAYLIVTENALRVVRGAVWRLDEYEPPHKI